jgi:hypothetical protein
MTNFFPKNELSGNNFFDRLRDACDGLVLISEIDSPIEPFEGITSTSVTHDAIAESFPVPAGRSPERGDVDDFFRRTTTDREWHTDLHAERVRRFRFLRKLLDENLQDVTLVRYGDPRVLIVIAGIARNGRLTGIKTEAVET